MQLPSAWRTSRFTSKTAPSRCTWGGKTSSHAPIPATTTASAFLGQSALTATLTDLISWTTVTSGESGLTVAIVEPHLIGGECSFYACMPSKALLRPGELLAEVRRITGVAEAVTGELDVRAVLDRRDEIIHGLDDKHMEPWLE